MPLGKTSKLTVEYAVAAWRANKNYRVTKVTDTVEYTPGDLLTKDEVDTLCHKRSWTVTIVPVK